MVFDGVPVRLYEPVSRSGILTGVIYYHGGGWISGSLGRYILSQTYYAGHPMHIMHFIFFAFLWHFFSFLAFLFLFLMMLACSN